MSSSRLIVSASTRSPSGVSTTRSGKKSSDVTVNERTLPDESAEEGVDLNLPPHELVATLALRKGEDVVARIKPEESDRLTILIACDTLAECDGNLLGKPVVGHLP